MTYRDRYHLGRVVQVSIFTSTRTEMYPNDSSLSMDKHNILRFQESRLEELVRRPDSFLCFIYHCISHFGRLVISCLDI